MENERAINPAAPHDLPPFVTAPGETDVLLVVMGIFLLLTVLGIGILYFKLHALPEHLAHRGQKVQLEIVAVLGLLSLFTHNHLFWIAGLLLALVPLPDFTTPLASMAHSLGRMAGRDRPLDAAPRDEPAVPGPPPAEAEPVAADHRPIEQRRA